MHLFLPALGRFQQNQPGLHVRYIETAAPLRLEYGEAHIAFRIGAKPDHPDYVVRHFDDVPMGLYAHKDYVRQYGPLGTQDENRSHRFVVMDGALVPPPLAAWQRRNIPKDAITLRSTGAYLLRQAINGAQGVGFMPMHLAKQQPDLVEMASAHQRWRLTVWMVTHVDLHRSAKVQAFLGVLNDEAQIGPSWRSFGSDQS